MLVAALLGAGILRAMLRFRRAARVAEELRSTGRRVPGLITSVRHTGLEIMDQPIGVEAG